jgi:tetratricopeptide (TPR) repeat protein
MPVDSTAAFYQKAHLKLESGNLYSAKTLYERIYHQNPEAHRALIALGGICRDLELYDESVDYTRKAVLRGIGEWDQYGKLYPCNFTTARAFDEGIQTFQNALRSLPNKKLYIYAGLAELYRLDEQFDRTEEMLRRLVNSTELQNQLYGYKWLSRLRLNQGRFGDALTFRDSMAVISNKTGKVNLDVPYHKARSIYWGYGDKAQARRVLLEADSSWTASKMSQQQWMLKYLLSDGNQPPGDSEPYPRKAMWNTLYGPLAVAETLADSVKKMWKGSFSTRRANSIAVLYLLAERQHKNHRYEEAIENLIFLQGHKHNGVGHHGIFYPKSHYLLGKIYEAQGLEEKALQHYNRFLDIYREADADLPDFVDAKKRLAALAGAAADG